MSDIGILSDPISQIEIALILGGPGFLLGAILGVLLWRKHRVAGALLGAIAGFGIWLAGWMLVHSVI